MLWIGAPAVADPVRDAQWHLRSLRVVEAHQHSQGEGVVIGLVDTGVDAGHPDLSGSVLSGEDFTTRKSDGREDLDGHGTVLAGLMVAHGQALGVAPKAQVLSIREKVYHDVPGAPDLGIQWAIDNGARVLCLAFVEAESAQTRDAIARAVANDLVVVAGIGNEPSPPGFVYPAAYPGVIAAAGVDRDGNHAEISVVSPFTVLSAPAVDIVAPSSRAVGSGYSRVDGTSASTAIIAGAAALVRAKFPQLSAAEVVRRLTATADDRGPPGRDDEYGFGIVNLVDALTAEVPPLPPSPSVSAIATAPVGGGGVPTRTITVIAAITAAALLGAAFALLRTRRRSHDGSIRT